MEGFVGSQIGPYQVTRFLAQGDTTEVYLGEHTQTHRRVALKIISASTKEPSTTVVRVDSEQLLTAANHVAREARLLSHFNHLHIVRAIDYGVEKNIAYVALEYIRDSAFHLHYPKGTQLPQKVVLSFVKQIAETLHYLHGLKVIHRHLKPEHLLLAPGNRVVLCGFGQALSPWEAAGEEAQEFLGTQTYMAPEQFQGRALPASDQYALGIMVYEWFCGEPPFTGPFKEIEQKHLQTPPPSMIEKRWELPLAVEEVVWQALAKEPRQRFANVNLFARALERACASG